MVTAREDMTYVQAREAARDLRKSLSELEVFEESEVIIKETSPARRKYILYSLEDGSEVPVFRYRVDAYLATGRFTSDPSRAPTFTRGEIKCFLAKDSPERAELNAMGLTRICKAEHLGNLWSKEEHARKKHRAEWASFQHHKAEAERVAERELRRQEVEAFKAMAGAAPAAAVAEPTVPCDIEGCDFEAKNAFGLQAHKRNKHGGE